MRLIHKAGLANPGITPQLIALESCSSPQKTQQVFESAMKFFFWFWVFCEWRHKWGRFLAILAHVTWSRAQLLDGSTVFHLSFHSILG